MKTKFTLRAITLIPETEFESEYLESLGDKVISTAIYQDYDLFECNHSGPVRRMDIQFRAKSDQENTETPSGNNEQTSSETLDKS